ncbi:MAG: hypothetical protein M1825_001464, partial [Sarcosagium campestre]
MPFTGLFHIADLPSTPNPTQLLDRLTKTHRSATPLPRWALEHRLFRSTVPASASNKPINPTGAGGAGGASTTKTLQLLTLSHVEGRSFISIAPVGGGGGGGGSGADTTTAASTSAPGPSPSSLVAIRQGDDMLTMLLSKMTALWTLRQTIGVAGGIGIEVLLDKADPDAAREDAELEADTRAVLDELTGFRVRIGELRLNHGAQPIKGIVIETQLLGGSGGRNYPNPEDSRVNEQVIRAIWDGMGLDSIVGGKEFLSVRSPGANHDAD